MQTVSGTMGGKFVETGQKNGIRWYKAKKEAIQKQPDIIGSLCALAHFLGVIPPPLPSLALLLFLLLLIHFLDPTGKLIKNK